MKMAPPSDDLLFVANAQLANGFACIVNHGGTFPDIVTAYPVVVTILHHNRSKDDLATIWGQSLFGC